MATNITPHEALEKIANMKGFKSYHATIYADGQLVPNTMPQLEMWTLDDAIKLATQALAYQESQECDVTKCEFYNDGSCKLWNMMSGKGGYNCGSLGILPTKCKDYPNCHYKQWQRAEQQLYSQQKTFTVEEIRKILCCGNTDLEEWQKRELLVEFEKAVG